MTQSEKIKSQLQPCAACGRLSTSRWCSNSCFIAEDGPPDQYYREDYEEEDIDEDEN